MLDDEKLTDAKIAASEARLRGEMNEKFAELRGELKLMSADISSKLDKAFSKIDVRFSEMDTRLSTMEGRLSTMDTSLSTMDTRLSEQRTDIDKKLAEHRSDLKADFRANRNLMIGLAVSVSGLMLAILIALFTVGGTMFSRGIQMRDVIRAVHAEDQLKVAPAAKP